MTVRLSQLDHGALARGIEHLAAVDRTLRAIALELPPPFEVARRLELAPGDHFAALFVTIVGQRQPEATTIARLAQIRARFRQLAPSPAAVVALADPELTELVGTARKASYVRGLATAIVDGRLDLAAVARAPDEVIAAQLAAIRGLGPWSIEQFLFWHLERPDILVTGDPAVRHAAVAAYQLPRFDAEVVARLSAPWRPYRSLAAHLLLRSRFGPGISPRWPTLGRPHGADRRALPTPAGAPR